MSYDAKAVHQQRKETSMYGEKQSDMEPSPELAKLFEDSIKGLAEQMLEEGKRHIWSTFNGIKYETSWAVGFIERQAQHPCTFGGDPKTCECYPHQARRFMDKVKEAIDKARRER